jgi:hypothetical protein
VRRRLTLDAVAVEVVREFRRHGIEPILLKGRSIADRLYAGAAERTYVDVDLLVAPTDHRRAGGLLEGLGFSDVLAGARRSERPKHAVTYARTVDGAAVDLHRTLPAAAAEPAVVWRALRERVRPLRVGSESLSALDDTGLMVHIAMHAAESGRHVAKPMADLARALAAFDASTIDSAADLAAQIGSLPQFVAGLRLVPAGRAWAAVLGDRVTIPALTAARALGGAWGSAKVGTVATEPWWHRPITVAHLVFPSRTMLRRSMPLARRGRLGLLAAYALRPLWMVVGLPAAVRSWRLAQAWSGQRCEP